MAHRPHRIARLVLAIAVVTSAAGAAAAPLRGPAERLGFTVTPDRSQAWAGESVTVTVGDEKSDYYLTGCELWFAGAPPTPCAEVSVDDRGKSVWSASPEVPEPATPDPTELSYRLSFTKSPGSKASETITDALDFLILRVDVTVDRAVVPAGGTVGVEFAAWTTGLVIVTCGAGLTRPLPGCDGTEPDRRRTARVTVPEEAAEGSELSLRWEFAYAVGQSGLAGRDGIRTVRVGLRPPEFEVRPGSERAGPGEPFTTTFASRTTGVAVKSCAVVFAGERGECSPSGVSVVTIPAATPLGTSVTLSWSLTYTSRRRGEAGDSRAGSFRVRVEAVQPKFEVTVQPGSAPPGGEVTLTFRSLREDVGIVECIAFFPGDFGGLCQRSTQRWFARTRVPADTPAGVTLLRWGIDAVTAGGRRVVDDGAIAFPVRGTTRPRSTVPGGAARGESGGTTGRGTTGGGTTGGARGSEQSGERPAFVATADPESAEPGARVTVTVATLSPGVAITGCGAAFPGERGSACVRSGGRWSATVTVPDDAEPGDLSLDWTVAHGSDADEGAIAYRVRAADRPPPPEFVARAEPQSVAGGGRVTVALRPVTAGVTITGCRARFGTDGTEAECLDSGGPGWQAAVAVPEKAPPGTGRVLWNVAYTTAGSTTPAAADGLVTVGVLPVAEPAAAGWWSGLTGVAGRVLLGGLILAALVLSGPLRRRILDWLKRLVGADPPQPPGSVRVEPLIMPPVVTVSDPDVGPRRLVTLTLDRGRPDVRLRPEDSP